MSASREKGSPAQFAAHVGGGVTDRQIRNWVKQGMPGARRSKSGRITIDFAKAEEWCAKRSGRAPAARRVRQAVKKKTAPKKDVKTPEMPAAANGSLDGNIEAARHFLATLGDLLRRQQSPNPDLVDSWKKASAELRMLEEHRRKQRMADRDLVDRTTFEQTVVSLAQLFSSQVEVLPKRLPELVMRALGSAGVEIKDPKRAARVLSEKLDEYARSALKRIADEIDEATDGANDRNA